MKMDERTLISQIEAQERAAAGYYGGEIAAEQGQAMDYYLRQPFGTEEEGRSQVVSSDVWDVVEGLTPVILKPFVSTDDIVRFNAEGAEDEEAAEQESDYINYVVTQKNDVFATLVSWVKTGLLQKNGVVKYWWDKSKRTTIERYEGISDDLYTAMLDEPHVTVVEHTERQGEAMLNPETGEPMPGELLHDVVMRVSHEYGCAKYCVIPPEEFLIAKDATSPNPKDAKFSEHRTKKSLSEIRAMGFDVDDDISDVGTDDAQFSPQYQARRQYEEGLSTQTESYDPASREVWFRDIYMEVDYDGDGITELRRVCMVGREILLNEETEEVPFCAWTPYQQAFKFYGRCPADETLEIQLTKSTLWRQNLDNIYTINNNRVFASDKVNLDDLLDNQIAGVVRVRGDVVSNHVMTAPIQPIGAVIQPMLEYLDSAKENRTGFTRYNQGSDADSLNKTATGIRIISEAGNERINLVSRSFAEMGLKPLMLGIHGLCRRHATKAETVRLRGKWVTINPRDWKTRYDMTVSVGLGNSDMAMKMQGAQLMLQQQIALAPAGIVKPKNFYNAARKLAEAVGEKNPDKYFTSPDDPEEQGQEQAPDPQVMAQMEQMQQELQMAAQEVEKLTGEIQKRDMDTSVKERELDLKERTEAAKMDQSDNAEARKVDLAERVARINAESAERMKLIEIAGQMMTAQHHAEQSASQEPQEPQDVPDVQGVLLANVQALQQMVAVLSAPRVLVRDAQGRAVGSELGGMNG